MRTDDLQQAVDDARKFIDMAAFVEEQYGTYQDGRGYEHYVSGPACAQLKAAARDLACTLSDLRLRTAAKLPAIPTTSKPKTFELRIDLETLSQPGWHEAMLVECD